MYFIRITALKKNNNADTNQGMYPTIITGLHTLRLIGIVFYLSMSSIECTSFVSTVLIKAIL